MLRIESRLYDATLIVHNKLLSIDFIVASCDADVKIFVAFPYPIENSKNSFVVLLGIILELIVICIRLVESELVDDPFRCFQ